MFMIILFVELSLPPASSMSLTAFETPFPQTVLQVNGIAHDASSSLSASMANLALEPSSQSDSAMSLDQNATWPEPPQAPVVEPVSDQGTAPPSPVVSGFPLSYAVKFEVIIERPENTTVTPERREMS